MNKSSTFTLGSAIKLLLLIGLVTVLLVIVQSCQYPKTGIDRFAKGSLKTLTVLTDPPPQPNVKFENGAGRRMQLSDYRGKVVLLNAWATWCPPCVAEMPSLNELQALKGDDDFQVVTVSLDNKAHEAQKWLAKKKLKNLPDWHDGTYYLNSRAEIRGLPTTIIYNREGREVARLVGDAEWSSPEALRLIDYLKAQ